MRLYRKVFFTKISIVTFNVQSIIETGRGENLRKKMNQNFEEWSSGDSEDDLPEDYFAPLDNDAVFMTAPGQLRKMSISVPDLTRFFFWLKKFDHNFDF